MSEIRIEAMTLNELPPHVLEELAELYCSIWREPEWNETRWMPASFKEKLRRNLADNPCPKLLLAFAGERMAGFTWGREVSKAELRKKSGSERLDDLFDHGQRVFYINEVGVRPECRGYSIGERLTSTLIECVSRMHGIRRFLLVTSLAATPARKLYAKLGFRELGLSRADNANLTFWLLDRQND